MAAEFGMMGQMSPCCMTTFLSQLPIPGRQRILLPSHHVHPNGTCIPGHSIFQLARFACLPVQQSWADLMTSDMGWRGKSAANHDASEVHSGTTIANCGYCVLWEDFSLSGSISLPHHKSRPPPYLFHPEASFWWPQGWNKSKQMS